MNKRRGRPAKSWKIGHHVPLTLWTVDENQLFYAALARSTAIARGVGLKLSRGVLDMGALEVIMRGLVSNDYSMILMEELDADYPRGSWWDMVWHLADLHSKLGRHSMFEINFKLLRTIEHILLPLNAMFTGQPMNPQYVAQDGMFHPLTSAVVRYCDYCYSEGGAMPALGEHSFIDFFMQAMLAQHGSRMCTFLQICRDNMLKAPPSPLSEDDELAEAMGHLSIRV
ncbi:hypothetical protein IWQ56_000299 [Coemansia nantahalensis]|nr:hypothetical protein IWQ56_000299 [Coemansia nantahalensis]